MSQLSSFLATNTSASIRMSHSKRVSRRGKLRDTLRVSQSTTFRKNLSASRKTIYLDENNNIVNPVTKSIIQKRTPIRTRRNIQKIVFEPSSSEGIWDNVSSTHSGNESMFDNSVHSPQILSNLKYPNIIPENGTLDFRQNKSNKFKGRFKSVSPIRE